MSDVRAISDDTPFKLRRMLYELLGWDSNTLRRERVLTSFPVSLDEINVMEKQLQRMGLLSIYINVLVESCVMPNGDVDIVKAVTATPMMRLYALQKVLASNKGKTEGLPVDNDKKET